MINNGSTLVDDIDLRNYYHVETNVNDVHHATKATKEGHTNPVDKQGNESEDNLESSNNVYVGVQKKSELFLTSTSVDDNGTFACIASNSAGAARANFTLHVVVPLDPPPPLVSPLVKNLHI